MVDLLPAPGDNLVLPAAKLLCREMRGFPIAAQLERNRLRLCRQKIGCERTVRPTEKTAVGMPAACREPDGGVENGKSKTQMVQGQNKQAPFQLETECSPAD